MRNGYVFLIVFALAAIFISGCAQQSPDTSRFNRTEGEMCGGFAGFLCADGFFCQYSNGTQPSYPDESGACVQCPMYSPPSPTYISDCGAKGGDISVKQDNRGCLGPARCSVQ